MLQAIKLNESYSRIEGDEKELQRVFNFLKAPIPGAYFDKLVQRGIKPSHKYFCTPEINNGVRSLVLSNGLLDFLNDFGLYKHNDISEFQKDDIDNFFDYFIKQYMPFEPYDYQLRCAKELLQEPKLIAKAATSSGKSCIIFLILNYLYNKNKKGYIIVPNINLLTQLYSDFDSYFKEESEYKTNFLNSIEKQGGGLESSFDGFLTISTWQSVVLKKDVLARADFLICDECHKYKSDVSGSIVKESTNAKYKWGFTGTMPEEDLDKLELMGIFGKPRTYMTSRELIERGLGTPIKINSIHLLYNDEDKGKFRLLKNYQQQITFIKEHEKRTKLIVNLATKVKGNTLVLGTYTEHIKTLFLEIMKLKYPDVVVENKDITGKKSFEFQEKYGIYFLNGEDDGPTREKTRLILEEHDDAILVSNFSILSTGVNIKKLDSMIFASPLKSYTTITQSIGRGMRLHKDKSIFNVYDICDKFTPKCIFMKQYEERCRHSYNSEEFPIAEREIELN